MQSVGNQFQLLMVGGGCDTVFDMRRGGDLVVDSLMLNNTALVLKLRDVTDNTTSYEIRSMKVDNHAAGWRLVEMQRPGPLRFHAAGHMGRHAAPGPDPIKLLGDPQYQDVDVDFWWQGKTLAGREGKTVAALRVDQPRAVERKPRVRCGRIKRRFEYPSSPAASATQKKAIAMNEEELKKAIHSQPFEPIRIHLSNGTTFDLPHPDAILIGNRTSAVLVGQGVQVISNLHVNYVEPIALAH